MVHVVVMMVVVHVMMMVVVMHLVVHRLGGSGRGGGGFLSNGVTGKTDRQSGGRDKALDHRKIYPLLRKTPAVFRVQFDSVHLNSK